MLQFSKPYFYINTLINKKESFMIERYIYIPYISHINPIFIYIYIWDLILVLFLLFYCPRDVYLYLYLSIIKTMSHVWELNSPPPLVIRGICAKTWFILSSPLRPVSGHRF